MTGKHLNVQKFPNHSKQMQATFNQEFYASPICQSCKHFGECGGAPEVGLLDCLSFCCQNPSECHIVCRNIPEKFVLHEREVNGFTLQNIPSTEKISFQTLPTIIPMIYNGSKRVRPAESEYVALRFADLVNYRQKALKFSSRIELCKHFGVSTQSNLILSGVDHDERIEPWWSLGEELRREILHLLKDLGIYIVTTPNFSVFRCRPRTDNLHAMKRIAILFSEIQNAGINCALHTNARTHRDFERWTTFVRERKEVDTLSYEFITGSRKKDSINFHQDGLINIAQNANRDLSIIVRGTPQVIPVLREYFKSVTYIDSVAFMKTVKRRRARRKSNSYCGLSWDKVKTKTNEELDCLLDQNIFEQMRFLTSKYFASKLTWSNESLLEKI